MNRSFRLPSRQIHLDFHTGPDIPDVGIDFDAREFARTMKRAHVNSVTVFAKCHHGHLYYNTKRPERHPGLKKGLDLLGQQVEALHREGIRAPIYISVQCDEYAANTHPEWIARQSDGRIVGAGPFNSGWQILDMNSPYVEYLAEQTAEVLKVFKPIDGLFFDMCWDQPSSSHFAVAAMEKAGLDPQNEEHQRQHAHKVALGYMKRFHTQVKAANRDATVYFNSRPLHNLAEEVPYLGQVEIEALPTGGWGYMYFPTNVRFARTFGKEYLGMTARFHKTWADFGGLKPEAALEYETSQMVAHGAKCSIGDQLHPRGTLDPAAYRLIGKAYGRIAERESWLNDAKAVAQIGLFRVPSTSSNVLDVGGADEGATRMLTQLRHQFDVVGRETDWSKYELLILPDNIPIDETFARELARYVKKGGKILATGLSGLNADATKCVLPELRIKPSGLSPFCLSSYGGATYFRFDRAYATPDDSDHVMYERGTLVKPTGGARRVAQIVDPYFERSWKHFSSHFQTPPARANGFSAAVLSKKTGYISYPIFSAFANHGNLPYRRLVQIMLDALIAKPLVRVGGPSGLEATVMRQGKRSIVHLMFYTAERRTKTIDLIEDIIPLRDVSLELRLDREPKQVYLAPQRRPLAFDYRDGVARLTVPEIRGHEMVVFE